MSDIMERSAALPEHHPSSMKFAAAFLVGAMLAFDMGGPINKTALFFCFSLLEKTHLRLVRHRRCCRANAARRGGSCDVHCAQTVYPTGKRAASSAIVVGATVATDRLFPALAAPFR